MTSFQLVQVLESLVPTALQGSGYTVAVDANGNASIALWNPALGTAPTTEQLTTAFEEIQLAQAKTAQTSLIASASNAAQTSGFTSSALGSAYSYPSGMDDQSNLNHVITLGMIAPAGTPLLFWCKSPSGVEAFVNHTPAQINQVGIDGATAIMACKQKQNTLSTQISAATSVPAVQAIVW